jgi:double-strand break repair protein MRE11
MEKNHILKQESINEDDHLDEDIFKILITTDNHLGFREDDKIVGNDSFYAFNEALQM